MDDLISRQVAIDDLQGKDPSQIWDTADIEVWVNALPSADVQPVRHGKWVKKWHTGFHKELPCCSVCGHCAAFWWDYCPNCGARMDGE